MAARGWPADLTELPGVGPYTAAALASFAWDAPVAAVDTNVARVIERVDGTRRGPAALRRRAAELLPPGRAAAFNHAAMDLGATVCTARAPRCGACPLRPGCATRGPGPGAAPSRGGRPRFQDTDRYVRGRIVAQLVAGETPVDGYPDGRFARAVAGLERDGLVVRRAGRLALP